MFESFKDKNKLRCFTPEVMLATFIVEIAMMVYVLVRYKMNTVTRLILAMLFSLAVFQGVEYQICVGSFDIYITKIGFIVITLLPALGLHLISKAYRVKYLVEIGYFIALSFIFYIIFSTSAIESALCGGNYIIFETSDYLKLPYTLYYFTTLIVGMWISTKGSLIKQKNKWQAKFLFWMLMSYLVFTVPMFTLFLWNRSLFTATPSIMCGFAILTALILTFKVLPIYSKNSKRKGV